MKALKPITIKKTSKSDREKKVLLGLIEYFLKTGKPVGSNTLKEAGFEDLSSATIRNYFANLEEEGYLSQQHSSGGRIPTNLAYRFYAKEYENSHTALSEDDEKKLQELRSSETREIAHYLQQAAESLSLMTQMAVFLSAPRFDSDFILEIKLISIDHSRCLCIIITDFGAVQTEILHVDSKLSAFSTKRIEGYFHWRLSGQDKPENLTKEEEYLAQRLYNELLVRYIVSYSNFSDDEIYRTGFSKLLSYTDFQDTTILANSLALFENAHSMRLLLKECSKGHKLKFWIGEDLAPYSSRTPHCTVLAFPYYINKQCVGSFGLLGPIRMPYRQLFSLMNDFSLSMSEALTRNIYKFKISFRQPEPGNLSINSQENCKLGHSKLMLLEDKR